jgi:hypothetical protein
MEYTRPPIFLYSVYDSVNSLTSWEWLHLCLIPVHVLWSVWQRAVYLYKLNFAASLIISMSGVTVAASFSKFVTATASFSSSSWLCYLLNTRRDCRSLLLQICCCLLLKLKSAASIIFSIPGVSVTCQTYPYYSMLEAVLQCNKVPPIVTVFQALKDL